MSMRNSGKAARRASKKAPPQSGHDTASPAEELGAAAAGWSPVGERNVVTMIRLADSGNIDAGKRLIDLAARCMRQSQPLPKALAFWLSSRLDAVLTSPERAGAELRVRHERRHPPKSAEDMHGSLDLEAMEQMAAWAAFHAIRSGEGKTKASRNGKPTAYEIVADWLKQKGVAASERAVRRWYEDRVQQMKAEQKRLQEILKTLDG